MLKYFCIFVTIYSFGLGYWVSRSVDLKPQPRALYNLAVEYAKEGQFYLAEEYFKQAANYNDIYHTNYDLNKSPYGNHIRKAQDVLKTFNPEIYTMMDQYRKKMKSKGRSTKFLKLPK